MTPVGGRGRVRLQLGFNTRSIPQQMGCVLNTRILQLPQYFLHDVRVTQVQLDELYALLSAVKAGEVSDTEAIQCLSRSPHGVWAASDPITKLLLTIDVGDRTLAMAQWCIRWSRCWRQAVSRGS